MAHNIMEHDAMAYAGTTPWHGLGNRIVKGASLEEWKEQSGLTWMVERCRIAIAAEGEDFTADPHFVGIRRNDTKEVFSIVTHGWQEVQPGEILEFFNDIASTGGFELETAGSLKNGAKIWALATNGQNIAIKGTDIIKPYLLLSTGFDGLTATRGNFTGVRVVCNNTLDAAIFGAEKTGHLVKVPHSTKFDAGAMKKELGVYGEVVAEFEKSINLLADCRMDAAETLFLLTEWFGKKDEEGKLSGQSSNVIDAVARFIAGSPGSQEEAARGTAWGVLNGVTHFIDFATRAKSQDNRLHSAWFGRGAQLKAKVANDLMKVAA